MVDKEKFGQYLVTKRKEQNMTQREFAAHLYVTESAVSKWERGLSYPDISLVTAICETLHITEHELITASEDYRQRRFESLAEKYKKIHTFYNGILLGAFALSLVICFITNLAVSHHLSWFFLVLTAEMTAASFLNVPAMVPNRKVVWTIVSSLFSMFCLLFVCNCYMPGNWIWIAFTAIFTGYVIFGLPYILKEFLRPVGIGNHKALISLAADTIVIIMLLLVCMSCTNTPMYNFYETALPIYGISIVLPWVLLLVIRYTRFNVYFKAAACFGIGAVYTVICNSVIECIVNKTKFHFQPVNLLLWNDIYGNGNVTCVITIGIFILAVIFAAAGIKKDVQIRTKE